MVSLVLFSSLALALWNRWEVLMRVWDVFWKLEVKTLEISGIINPLFDERTFCSLPAFFHATTGFGKIQRNSINIRSCDRLNHRIWYRYPFVDVQWRWSMFFFVFLLFGRPSFLTITYQIPDGHKYRNFPHLNVHLETTWAKCMDISPRKPWWDGVPGLKWWCTVSHKHEELKFPRVFPKSCQIALMHDESITEIHPNLVYTKIFSSLCNILLVFMRIFYWFQCLGNTFRLKFTGTIPL